MVTNSILHYHILKSFVERGAAPAITELAVTLGESPDAVRDALVALEEHHGAVLHPVSKEVWAAHPFSAAPTNFWVENAAGGWWANCAWCAMGVVHLVGGTAAVTTTLGARTKQVTVHITDGELNDAGFLVHFPVPMARAWDNVVYACSTMLLFDSEASIAEWCRRSRIPRGDVRPLDRVLELAKVWYGRHLDPDWTKWSATQAAALFRRFGLDGPVWQIAEAADRF
jgi:hypothetical protein